MDLELLSNRLSYTLSITWLLAKLVVIIVSPLTFDEDCDSDLPLFIALVFHSTIISVFFQIVYLLFKTYIKNKTLSRSWRARATSIQIIYIICDYLVYGLFRFIVFLIGLVFLAMADDCSDFVWTWSLTLVIGYFGVCWVMCWIGCIAGCLSWWDAQTL